MFTGEEPMEIKIIMEEFYINEWWFAFLITYFHIGISSFIYSFITVKTID